MKTLCVLLLGILIVSASANDQDSTLDLEAIRKATMERYLRAYCDMTAGLGIGFIPSHTYDHEFRQRLKLSDDEELKRLFVLRGLYSEVESGVRHLQNGTVAIPRGDTRKMNRTEREAAKERIRKQIDDLALLDVGDPQHGVSKLRLQLEACER